MVQMKVTATVLLAAAIIAPVVAHSFEAEDSLVTSVISPPITFHFTNTHSNVAVGTTNLKAPSPETSTSTMSSCKLHSWYP